MKYHDYFQSMGLEHHAQPGGATLKILTAAARVEAPEKENLRGLQRGLLKKYSFPGRGEQLEKRFPNLAMPKNAAD